MSRKPPSNRETKKEAANDSANSLPTRLASIRATSSTTLGGVQKMRFAPKAPARRAKQESADTDSNSAQNRGLMGIVNANTNSNFGSEANQHRRNMLNQKKKRDFKQNMYQPISGPFSMGPASLGQPRANAKTRNSQQSSENGGIVYSASMEMKPSAFNQFGDSINNAKKEEMEDVFYNSEDEDDEDMTQEQKLKMAPVVLLTDQNSDTTLFGDKKPANTASSFDSEGNCEDGTSNLAHLFQTNTDFNNLMIFQLPSVMPKLLSIPQSSNIESKSGSLTGSFDTKVKSEHGAEPMMGLESKNPTASEDTKPDISKLNSQPRQAPKIKAADTSNDTATGTAAAPDFDFDSNADCEGQVAELVVHKSGKVFLEFGGIRMNVMSGIDCQFAQQLVALDVDAKQLFAFGSVRNRLICTPDLDSLFDDLNI